MGELLTLLYRTAILYVVALLVFRLMGKRTLAKMGPFDFAVLIMIGEAVALGIEDVKKPLWNAIGVTVALGLLQYILTWLNVRFRSLEKLTQGVPARLVAQGQPEAKRLRQERVSQADLMMELRQKDVENLSDVREAFLEPTGEISVRKSSSASPSTSPGNTDASNASRSSVPETTASAAAGSPASSTDVWKNVTASGERGTKSKSRTKP